MNSFRAFLHFHHPICVEEQVLRLGVVGTISVRYFNNSSYSRLILFYKLEVLRPFEKKSWLSFKMLLPGAEKYVLSLFHSISVEIVWFIFSQSFKKATNHTDFWYSVESPRIIYPKQRNPKFIQQLLPFQPFVNNNSHYFGKNNKFFPHTFCN